MSNNMNENTLMKSSARFILGETTGTKLSGSPDKISAYREVLLASKTLYDALCEERSIEEISKLIDIKRKSAQQFHKITGIVWRL